MDWLSNLLSVAQSAYFMTVVWGQIAFVFARKTQVRSMFSWFRLTNNKVMFWGVAAEVILTLSIIYIPGLNSALSYAEVPPFYAVTALWIIPLIWILEETRKFFVRRSPKGCLAKLTRY